MATSPGRLRHVQRSRDQPDGMGDVFLPRMGAHCRQRHPRELPGDCRARFFGPRSLPNLLCKYMVSKNVSLTNATMVKRSLSPPLLHPTPARAPSLPSASETCHRPYRFWLHQHVHRFLERPLVLSRARCSHNVPTPSTHDATQRTACTWSRGRRSPRTTLRWYSDPCHTSTSPIPSFSQRNPSPPIPVLPPPVPSTICQPLPQTPAAPLKGKMFL
jgi:hypothetical protein